MKSIAIIQARFGSTRLPGKILKNLAGRPQLYHVVTRSRAAASLDKVIVATSTDARDDATEAFCRSCGFEVVRGSEEDVLDRYYQAALPRHPDVVVRITADCPLVSPEGIDEVLQTLIHQGLDYCSWDLAAVPLGLGAEAFRFETLQETWRDARAPEEREHVTVYIRRHPERFKVLIAPTTLVPARTDLRLTVDTPEDFALMEKVFDALYSEERLIAIREVERFLDAHPEIKKINAHIEQKKV